MEGVESEIGVRIKALRKSNGISRRSFAMMVGLSASCLDEDVYKRQTHSHLNRLGGGKEPPLRCGQKFEFGYVARRFHA